MLLLEDTIQVVTPETFVATENTGWWIAGLSAALAIPILLTIVLSIIALDNTETVKARNWSIIGVILSAATIAFTIFFGVNSAKGKEEWYQEVAQMTEERYLAEDLAGAELFKHVRSGKLTTLELRTAPQEGYLPAAVQVDGRALTFVIKPEERVSASPTRESLFRQVTVEACINKGADNRSVKLEELCDLVKQEKLALQ